MGFCTITPCFPETPLWNTETPLWSSMTPISLPCPIKAQVKVNFSWCTTGALWKTKQLQVEIFACVCFAKLSFLYNFTSLNIKKSSNYFVFLNLCYCFKCRNMVHFCKLNNPSILFFTLLCAPAQIIYLVQSQIIYFPSFILLEWETRGRTANLDWKSQFSSG